MWDEAIRTEGLTKRFGDVLAVDGLDLSVRPGQIFGFLGPNGAGKTTRILSLRACCAHDRRGSPGPPDGGDRSLPVRSRQLIASRAGWDRAGSPHHLIDLVGHGHPVRGGGSGTRVGSKDCVGRDFRPCGRAARSGEDDLITPDPTEEFP